MGESLAFNPRNGESPCWDPKLDMLGADFALLAEVPTGPGARCGVRIFTRPRKPEGQEH
jgi:hypothetical protein